MDANTAAMMNGNLDVVAMIGVFIPIVAILVFPVVIWIIYRSRSKNKADIQLTLRTMIENGQALSPELLEQLHGEPNDKRMKDLRVGVILVAISIGSVMFGIFDEGIGGDFDDMFEAFGIASIFLLLGLARLALWKYTPGKNGSKAD